jgi:hypothetical protein
VLFINGFAAYLAFSPMHDATHSSIATVKSGHGYLNYLVGSVSGWMFPMPFEAFKWMHLQHHIHNGDKKRDPYRVSFVYHWGNVFSKVLAFFRREKSVDETFNSDTSGLKSVLNFNSIGIYGLLAYGMVTYPRVCLVCWLLPGRIALALLMTIFGEHTSIVIYPPPSLTASRY